MTNALIKPQKWWDLLAIQAGGTLCLPIVLIGQLLCKEYGTVQALCAILAGNGILLVLGLIMATMSTQESLNTFSHVRRLFGALFQKGLGALMLICMLGWFAVQINLMTKALPVGDTKMLTVSIGSLITLFMYFGYSAMHRCACLAAPLLGLGLLMFFMTSTFQLSDPPAFSWGWMSGISLVIGAHIAVLVDLPTFFQHAASPKDGRICITCLYALIVPLVEAGGVWLTSMLDSGADNLLVGVLFVLSGWSANNANLYSAVETVRALRIGNRKGTTLLLGTLGTVLACMNPLGSIETLLELIGVALGVMGSIMCAQFVYKSPSGLLQAISCASYCGGVVLGLLSCGCLTTSVTLDACLIGACLQLLSTVLVKTFSQRQGSHVISS